jgi:hypothetical protein
MTTGTIDDIVEIPLGTSEVLASHLYKLYEAYCTALGRKATEEDRSYLHVGGWDKLMSSGLLNYNGFNIRMTERGAILTVPREIERIVPEYKRLVVEFQNSQAYTEPGNIP